MKSNLFLLSITRLLAVLFLIAGICLNANAAAIMTLRGSAPDARYEGDSQVRLSILGWSETPQLEAVETAWQAFQENNDVEAFIDILEQQDTRGYIFTSAATGYRIKYAWQDNSNDESSMLFIVTPALKTRNPYLWHNPGNEADGFSLVEVQLVDAGESGVAKISQDGTITTNAQGRLVLDNFENVDLFASMHEDTPYYLKNNN